MRSATESIDRLFQTVGARAVVLPARGGPSLDVREDRHLVVMVRQGASKEPISLRTRRAPLVRSGHP